jgi:hypothetical protein
MHNPAMPKNKPSPNPPALSTGAGVNQEEDYEKIINDPRFKEILDDCMAKCIKERECNNINCVKKCFYNSCFRVAWILYHAWYSSPTASTASTA